jgi:hypothetical protein
MGVPFFLYAFLISSSLADFSMPLKYVVSEDSIERIDGLLTESCSSLYPCLCVVRPKQIVCWVLSPTI